MKVRWNDVMAPVQQDFDPAANLDNIVVTVKKLNGPTMEVAQTSATIHPNGDANLEIWIK